MFLDCNVQIDFEPLNKLIDSHAVPKDGDSSLVMSNGTVRVLTGKSFGEIPNQSYCGYRIFRDDTLALGEVIVLANFEVMSRLKSGKK